MKGGLTNLKSYNRFDRVQVQSEPAQVYTNLTN